jgi:Ca-activated chloride channel family protein
VTTIGLGRGYNEDLMARLAGASDGNHDFAETADDLRRIFNREFDDVLSVIAQDIEIIIELPRGVRPLRSLGRDAEIAGNRAVFKVAQAYAKSTHSLQLELEVDADFALGEREMANVVVRYRPHGDATRTSQPANVRATFSADAERAARSIDPVVMDPVVELIAREKTRQAIQLRDEGRTKEARTLLHKAKKFIGYHNQNLEQFGHQRSGRMQALEQQYAKDAEAIAQRDWNVQRKSMRKGLGNAAGSSVKY